MIAQIFIISVMGGLFEILCHNPTIAFTSIQTNTISTSENRHNLYSKSRRRTRATTFLRYKDERITNDDESYQKEQQQQQHQQAKSSSSSSLSSSSSRDVNQSQRTIIPVIGPLPNVATLLPGQEYVLKSPTPMQWNSIQEALSIHRKQYSDADDEVASSSSIEQAPIMAFLDDHTATSNPGKGRYATIVAIVGMSSSSSSSFDNTKFDLKTFLSNTRSVSLFDSTKIRFVAVGRAILEKFFYQVPTVAVEENTDEEGYINDGAFLLNGKQRSANPDVTSENEEDEDDELVHDDVIQHKQDIIMSEFRLVLDALRKNGNVMSSPIHSVAEMSQLTFQIQLLHQERQKLVQGIKAGRARLELSRQKQSSTKDQKLDKIVEFDDEWDLFDFDGIGALFGFPIEEEIVDEKTETQTSAVLTVSKNVPKEPLPESNEVAERASSSEPSELQTKYINYGLGTRSSSVASISDLTNVRLEQLEPYYSPTRRATEEHYYEILSYVAVDAVLEWITPSHIAWAVGSCTNTVERLQHIHEWMDSHASALKYEAYLVSDELIQCGEECTDLW